MFIAVPQEANGGKKRHPLPACFSLLMIHIGSQAWNQTTNLLALKGLSKENLKLPEGKSIFHTSTGTKFILDFLHSTFQKVFAQMRLAGIPFGQHSFHFKADLHLLAINEKTWCLQHSFSSINHTVCSLGLLKQSVWDLTLTDYFECLITLPHLVLVTMSMSQFLWVYESLLADYESMKRKRGRESERKLGGRTKRRKEKESRTPWLLTNTVCSKHSSFIPLSSFCSPFIKRICGRKNISEEFPRAEEESRRFASTPPTSLIAF